MKILILGGTSFFGYDIASQLTDRGHQVTLFTRGQKKLPDTGPKLERLVGDRAVIQDLERAAKHASWDAVIDNIAFNAGDVSLAMKAFSGAKRYILTSSVSVYRFSTSRFPQPLMEHDVDYDARPTVESSEDRHWTYARGKMEAEKALIRQNTTAWTIMRPTVVYGPRDVSERGFWYLARLMDGGPIVLANGGMNCLRLVYSHDVASAYAAAVERDASAGRAYNIAGHEIITLRDFIDESAKAMGAKPHYVSMPFEKAGEFAGPYAYERTWIPSIDAAKRDLGYRPTNWAEVSATTACWFRDCWSGDKSRLLANRDQELKLAARWKDAMSKF